MQRSRLIELLAKKKAGSISLKEQFELSKWLQEDDDDRELVNQIDGLFAMDLHPERTEEDLGKKEKSWDRIMKSRQLEDGNNEATLPKAQGFKWRPMRSLAAASVFLLCVAGAVTYLLLAPRKEARTSENVVGTEKGSRSTLTLPDGSRVWLNGDSRISYGASFGKNNRELTLTGEAYFDVAKDPGHPMIIKTATVTIKVLGTAFNVRAYPDEKTTATTLVQGKVQVSVNHKEQLSYLLSPDEKLIVKNDSGLSEIVDEKTPEEEKILENITKIKLVKTDSIPAEAQWIRNKLVFVNQPLHEISNILSRWYGVNVVLQGGEQISSRKFTGIYENQTIQSVMESLQVAGGFSFRMRNDTIFIAP